MDKSYFIKLLSKYLKGDASEAECNYLYTYYNQFDKEPDVIGLLNESQKKELKDQMQNNIWYNINILEDQDSKPKLIHGWISKVAAIAAILAICLTSLLYFNNNPLSSRRATIEVKEQHRLIRLSDGSIVLINAGSTLTYPSSFEGLAKREVYLVGQAYFDIKHNAEKPFIVHTGKLETTVLGTAFNIKAWPNEEDISITVTRGRVKVDDSNKDFGILVPDQQLTYNKEKADGIQKQVDTKKYLAWKEEDLLFDDVTIAEAAELLKERFKVDIICEDEIIRSKRFTTTFLKDESLEHILKSICEFNNAVYQYDKDKAVVTITKDNERSAIPKII